MNLEEKKTLAERLLQTPINWYEDDRGTLQCPGHAKHTKKTADKHTILYLDGVPTLYCWHQSCAEKVEEANAMLRDRLCDDNAEEKAESKEKYDAKCKAQSEADWILTHNDWLLSNYHWPEVFDRPDTATSFTRFMRTLWHEDDMLWVGDVWDTGPVKGPGHFKAAGSWLAEPPNLYANRFTTAATYKPNTCDRAGRQVLTSPYIVVEFDKLSEDIQDNRVQGAAFLKFISRSWDLVAVVDSGNKSLHGWFVNNEKVTDQTKQYVVFLGADAKTMRPAQAVRVPGGKRENGKVQSLLWIK